MRKLPVAQPLPPTLLSYTSAKVVRNYKDAVMLPLLVLPWLG